MALPVPAAALHRVARRGWPLLVAALLTVLLGWAALHEGRGAVAGPAGAQTEAMQAPAPDGTPPPEHGLMRAEAEPEPGRGGKPSSPPPAYARHSASLHVCAAMSPAAALPFPLRPLRQPPGQAPPARA